MMLVLSCLAAAAVGAAAGSIADVDRVVLFMQENRAFDHYFGRRLRMSSHEFRVLITNRHHGWCTRVQRPQCCYQQRQVDILPSRELLLVNEDGLSSAILSQREGRKMDRSNAVHGGWIKQCGDRIQPVIDFTLTVCRLAREPRRPQWRFEQSLGYCKHALVLGLLHSKRPSKSLCHC